MVFIDQIYPLGRYADRTITVIDLHIRHPPGSDLFSIERLFQCRVTAMLILLGVMGLYIRQANRLGLLGLIAFLVIFFSGMAFGGGQLIGAVIQPIYPQSGNPGGPFLTSSTVKLVLSIGELWLPGFLLFAILSLRARMFPRAGSRLIILSVAIGIAAAIRSFGSTISYSLADLATAIPAAALCLWGYALWSGDQISQRIAEAKVKEPLSS